MIIVCVFICFSCQSDLKKITTKAKISGAPLFIHKSKLIIVIQHFVRLGKTYS